MKKKNLTNLTPRELIDELRKKAGGVVNPKFKKKTRDDYLDYLNEILEELSTRELSDEELKEIKNLFPTETPATPVEEENQDSEDSKTPATPVEEENQETEDSETPATPVEEENQETENPETPATPVEEENQETENPETPATPVEEENQETEDSETPVTLVEEENQETEDSETPVTPVANENKDSEETKKPSKKRKSSKKSQIIAGLLWGALIVLAVCLVVSLVPKTANPPSGNGVQSENPGTEVPGTQDQNPTQQPDSNDVQTFDINSFKVTVTNIVNRYTKIDRTADISKYVDKVGEEELKNQIALYGQDVVAENVAQLVVFGTVILANEAGLSYNPNAEADYRNIISKARAEYVNIHAEDPEIALTKLADWDAIKSNRDLVRAAINATGNADLLQWYNTKTSAVDVKFEEIRETDSAKAFIAQVLENPKAVELLSHQLSKVKAGEITVLDENGTPTETYINWIQTTY